MAWKQKTKPSLSGSQKRAAAKAAKSGNTDSADQKRARAKALMTQAEGTAKDSRKQELANKIKSQDSRDAALAVSAKKANNKRKQVAQENKRAYTQPTKEDRSNSELYIQPTKEEPKQKSIFADIFSFLRDTEEPVAPSFGGGLLTERLPTSTGAGMLGAGVANYPTGTAKGLELPSSPLGMLGALNSPMGSMLNQVRKVFMNQSNYGMNDEAQAEYYNLLSDPANAGKSTEELVQLARKPQMDRQLPHAFIDGNPTTDVQKEIARLTGGRAPSSTVYNSDGTVNIGATATMVSPENNNNQGNPAATPTEIIERAQLGQLTTGGAYAPTVMPDTPWWAPQGNQGAQVQEQPSWAPQWNLQAKQARPSWAPKEGGMLKAPMTLQAPPSRWS